MSKQLIRFLRTILSGIILTVLFSCVTTPPESAVESENPGSPVPEQPAVPEEESQSVGEKLSFYHSLEDTDEALAVLEESREQLTADELVLLASLQISEGRLEEARSTLEGVLKDQPAHADALYNFAMLEDAAGNPDARDSRLTQTLSADPDHTGALILKGMIHLIGREYAEADSLFARVLQSQPDNFLALSGAATSQMNLENLKKATELLDRAIELEPEFAYLYVDRARAWKGQKNYGNAEADFSRAIELEPDVEWHYLDRARIRIQYFHDLDGAWEDLVRLEELNPDNFFGNVYMAGILDDRGEYDSARDYYEKILAARPEYGFAHEPLAKIAYMDGRYADSRDHFLRAFDFESRDFCYILSAAVAMEKLGDRKSAESLLKEVAPRVPRGSLEYEMFRYYLSPGSDFFIVDRITKEENEDLKSRMYYYLGARYDLKGLRQSAVASYGKVAEKSEFYETDLAAWELDN